MISATTVLWHLRQERLPPRPARFREGRRQGRHRDRRDRRSLGLSIAGTDDDRLGGDSAPRTVPTQSRSCRAGNTTSSSSSSSSTGQLAERLVQERLERADSDRGDGEGAGGDDREHQMIRRLIAGTVTGPSNEPVQGIEVWAFVAGTTGGAPVGEVLSASDGSYAIPNLANGSYDLYYFPSSSTGSWLSGWYEDASSQQTATPVAVKAPDTSTADIVLEPGATIDGTVTGDGHRLSGIQVTAYLAGTNTVAWESNSATNGTYSERNLPRGKVRPLLLTTPSASGGAVGTGSGKIESRATPV